MPGVALKPDALKRQPTVRLSAIGADHGAHFLNVMNWVVEKLKGALSRRGKLAGYRPVR